MATKLKHLTFEIQKTNNTAAMLDKYQIGNFNWGLLTVKTNFTVANKSQCLQKLLSYFFSTLCIDT